MTEAHWSLERLGRQEARSDLRSRRHDDLEGRNPLAPRATKVRWIVSLLLLAMVFGCATHDGRLAFANRKPLRIGVAPNYPPVIFEEDGEILGIEADLAHSIADALGRRAVFSSYPLSELIDALEADEIDVVMSGLSITPERSKRIRFTAPYMKIGQLALIRSSELIRLGRKRSIYRSGVRVGYERGSTGEEFVARQLPRAISFAFDDVNSAIRSLRAARIDFFIHDAPTIWRLAGDPASRDLQGLYHFLTEEHLAWAVRHDDLQLHALLDATLSHWKREGRIEPIVNRWIPVRVTLR
ncbi:MAG: transporter substrate-binding domain-containing protein [Myxococcales bacterium]|nr:transporter substrate-binding domain-containing protein [Myxococcales bacterium]HIK84713.1 transporter substrate-binding domain-containing protein [Myxococcales bacterium]